LSFCRERRTVIAVLIGRSGEEKRLEMLLEEGRSGRSGALVLRGEAGVGKTALLEYAVGQAEGFRVLRALGVSSEAEIAFAGLQQLLRPIMQALAGLPGHQMQALSTALAIEEGPAPEPERLTVSAGTLSLLAGAGEDGPLLCAVEALTFAARRLHAEGVVMLFAAREPERTVFPAPGIPELRVEGLAPVAARALLAERVPDLAGRTAEQLVGLARGNPLALLELPRMLSGPLRAGRTPLTEPLAVDAQIERAFLERASALSQDARRALLLVATGDPDDVDAVWEALETEHLGRDALAEAEGAGLLVAERLAFCHPLARSAVYQLARPADRRAAHAALAVATTEPDRRAWQLAAAADRPDEQVAAALEEAAAVARRRGGVAAEAKALDRAAQLTTNNETRAQRLLKAAFAAEAAGWLEYAEAMLSDAAELTRNSELRARAVARRSYLLADRGEFDQAYALAVDEAEYAKPSEAAHLLSGGAFMALIHHGLDIRGSLEIAERAWQLAGSAADADLPLCQMLSRTLILAGRTEEALALVRSSIDRVDAGSVLAIDFGTDLFYLEDYSRASEVLERVVERAREAEASGTLSYALDQLARLETRVANLTRAYSLELESLQLTEPLGNDVALAASLAWLGVVEAMLGRAETRAHSERALQIAEGVHDDFNAVRARGALGLDALGRGDPVAALAWLEPAVEKVEEGAVGHPNFFRVDADLIEALARLRRNKQAERHLARFEEQAHSTGSRWARAAAARCRGFLSPEPRMREVFETALVLHEEDPSRFERARTELCYGERLRRARQRRLGREQLRSALETFEHLEASPWAERARVELRATGEHVHRRDPTVAERLTPQEFQVALLVAEGLTNRDVAARLFLSPKTVEFHLGGVFRKLNVRSRGELIRLFAAQTPEHTRV
jgi:DNA-binding CsgD family transcriptional regulator